MKKFLVSLFLPITLHAVQLAPWYENDLEVHLNGAVVFQQYNRLSVGNGSVARASFASFLTGSADISYNEWRGEFETTLAHSRDHIFGFDDFALSVSYRWYDDILGDPFSLTTGLRLIRATTSGLHDISSFHHGKCEAVANVAIGRESAYLADWLTRYWANLGIGIADFGSPWLTGDLVWEKNWPNDARLTLFTHFLGGFGGNRLNPHHFSGYGPIRHRSIDIGFKYTLFANCLPTFALGYSYRIYAKNFPSHTNRLFLSMEY